MSKTLAVTPKASPNASCPQKRCFQKDLIVNDHEEVSSFVETKQSPQMKGRRPKLQKTLVFD